MAESPYTKHVDIIELARGVIASLARPGGAAVSNAGAIDLGDVTVVFDTHGSPQAGRELRQAAEALAGGRPPRLVVNSHDHNDHVLGNMAFADGAAFIANEHVRQLLFDSRDEDLGWAEGAPEHLDTLRAQLDAAQTEFEREAVAARMRYMETLAEMHGRLEVVVPQVGLEGRTVLEGPAQLAELIPFERAHAGSDTVLHLPYEAIVFAGDIVSVGIHPFIGQGDSQALLDALQAIERMRPRVLVPGHGPLGGVEDVVTMQAYVHDLTDVGTELIAEGRGTVEGIRATAVPQRYEAWGQRDFFYLNLREIVGRMLGAPVD